MSDEPSNLVLELLRGMRADMQKLHEDNRELKVRVTEVYTAVIGLRRDQVNDAEVVSRLQVTMDRVNDRLDRVERRLSLSDG